jgi:hypothetical protein
LLLPDHLQVGSSDELCGVGKASVGREPTVGAGAWIDSQAAEWAVAAGRPAE